MPENQNVNIKVTSSIDKKGFDILQKELDDSKKKLAQVMQQQGKNSQAYKAAEARVLGLSSAIKKFKVDVTSSDSAITKQTSSLNNLNKSIASVESNTTGAGVSLSSLSGLMGGALAVGAGLLVSQLSKLGDLAAKGAAFDNLYAQFQRMNGGVESAAEKLELLQTASTGNLNIGELVEYTNGLNALGISTETAIKLLDIADNKGDDLGITFEAANSALEKYIITGAKRGLVEIGVNFAEVEEKIKSMTGKTEDQILAMDDLEQQTVRTDAVVALFGRSMDDIGKKTKGTDDKLANLKTQTANLSILLGITLANAFGKVSEKMGGFDFAAAENISKAVELGEKIGKVVNDAISLGKSILALQRIMKNFSDSLPGTISNLIKISNRIFDIIDSIESAEAKQQRLNRESALPKFEDESFAENEIKKLQERLGLLKEDAKERIELQKKIDTESKKRSSSNSRTKEQVTDTKELVNEVGELQRRMASINELIGITTPGTNLFLKYQEDVKNLQTEIDFLNSTITKLQERLIITGLDKLSDLVGLVNSDLLLNKNPNLSNLSQNVKNLEDDIPFKKIFERTLTDVEAIGGAISSAMNSLNIGTDTFVSKMLAGFDLILNLVKTVQTINSIFSFIPGLGGVPGASSAGLQRSSGINTSSLANSIRPTGQQAVNVYIAGSLDGQTFLKQNYKEFISNQKYTRVS